MVPIRQKPNGPTSTSASYTTGLFVVEPQKKGTTCLYAWWRINPCYKLVNEGYRQEASFGFKIQEHQEAQVKKQIFNTAY